MLCLFAYNKKCQESSLDEVNAQNVKHSSNGTIISPLFLGGSFFEENADHVKNLFLGNTQQ
jgi:hypothetical protein